MEFVMNNSPLRALTIGYKDKYIEETVNTRFLGLQLHNHLNLKNHIDQMTTKLSAACYSVVSMFHISNTDTLKSIHFAYFHSIIQYGILFWGNASNSRKIFTLRKKIVRIIVGARPRTPRRSLFKKLEICTGSMPIYIFIN
jgi:hypothetical protein